ncbi:MAG TPA: ATP-binding protein [Chloroflexota bacterium]|nr:ATP-binding protein [Chloroflexota bacterium]
MRQVESSGGLADSTAAIRADTFLVLLLAVGVALWPWLLVNLVHPDNLWPGWGLPLTLLLVVAACYALRSRAPTVAICVFVGGVLAGPTIILFEDRQGLVGPFLFILPVLIAGSLLGSRGSYLAAVLSSAAIGIAVSRGSPALSPSTALGALTLIWLTALASWATTRNLLIALRWAEANSERAAHNLEEARDYQARLSTALRQLEEANYRLERANYALTLARGEADEKRRLVAQFAAHVSHELRTPINLVVGFADLMLHHPETYGNTPLPAPYLTDLATLHRSARHLRALIDDILDLSQIDVGEMPVLKELTSIATIIQEAIGTARALLERKGLAIHVAVEHDLPPLRLDQLRIRQVLLNLLNNAARFTDEGGVTVRAFSRQHPDGERIIVEVGDTGIGIRPADLGTLFQPFHQIDSSPTRGRGGTGLGLVISKRFVELHGGTIGATSEGVAGRGSVFTVEFPVEPVEEPAAPETSFNAYQRWQLPAAPPPPTVVVHDDDPAIVSLFQRHLPSFQVVGAATPEQATHLARQRSAQVIITDVPGADGWEGWYAQWRLAEGGVSVPILGCPMPSGRRLARSLGLVDYLVKPVTREALLASVHAVAPDARTILVVDDEPRLVRLFCRMLQAASADYRFLRAFDGQQALDLARQDRPDLVLLDLLMPQVDGLTVLERLREDPALAGIPVVAVSARGAVEAITPSNRQTITLVNDRPLSVSRLLGLVQGILGALPPPDVPGQSSAPAIPVVGNASEVFG